MRCQVTRGRLLAALKAVIPCASEDTTREHLTCVAIVAEKVGEIPTLAFVATCGHAMTIARVQVREARFGGADAEQILLRPEDAKALVKLLAHKKREASLPVEVSISGNPAEIQFQVHGGTIARYVAPDLEYVPWRQVVPPVRQASEQKLPALIGLSPYLLARAGESADVFVREFWSTRNGGVLPRPCFELSAPASALDPVRLDMRHWEAGELTCVIMPMRI